MENRVTRVSQRDRLRRTGGTLRLAAKAQIASGQRDLRLRRAARANPGKWDSLRTARRGVYDLQGCPKHSRGCGCEIDSYLAGGVWSKDGRAGIGLRKTAGGIARDRHGGEGHRYVANVA